MIRDHSSRGARAATLRGSRRTSARAPLTFSDEDVALRTAARHLREAAACLFAPGEAERLHRWAAKLEKRAERSEARRARKKLREEAS